MNIHAILDKRKKTHGEYRDHARISQLLKNVMASGERWPELDDHEKETLEMVAHKVARILSGDPHFQDHWQDIAGYAQLSADRNPPMPSSKPSEIETYFSDPPGAQADVAAGAPLPKQAG